MKNNKINKALWLRMWSFGSSFKFLKASLLNVMCWLINVRLIRFEFITEQLKWCCFYWLGGKATLLKQKSIQMKSCLAVRSTPLRLGVYVLDFALSVLTMLMWKMFYLLPLHHITCQADTFPSTPHDSPVPPAIWNQSGGDVMSESNWKQSQKSKNISN